MVRFAILGTLCVPASYLADALRLPRFHIHAVLLAMALICCVLSPIVARQSRRRDAITEHVAAMAVFLLSYGFLAFGAYFIWMFAGMYPP